MKHLPLPAVAISLALILWAPPGPAHAAVVAGIEMPDSVRVEETILRLNGMGLYRRKVGIQVLVGGLYLSSPERDPEKILLADSPRRFASIFLRNISSGRICAAWKKGLDRNTPNASKEVREHFRTLCKWARDFRRGDEIAVTYLPGRGSTIEINGSAVGTIQGREFADAYFGLVLGPRPLNKTLKIRLLGG